jgi:hypothetical protein
MNKQFVTQLELVEVYKQALVRWGSYSKITIDAVTRDTECEIIIYCDDIFKYQGNCETFIINTKNRSF